MKIGILTFHWATNYGAVLQCYALQEYLREYGYDVDVINYKPRQYDDNFLTFLRFRKFLNWAEYLNERNMEHALRMFRHTHLHLTERVYRCKDMAKIANRYDIIISGSDQVVNPSFLLSGEGYGALSPTYFLGFPFNGKRLGYALSFGCVTYPESARIIASKYIKNFDFISVRENSGLEIIKSMGREDAVLVPDPTLLQRAQFYHTIADECKNSDSDSFIFSFFIRHISDRKSIINKIFDGKLLIWNNEDDNYTMEWWLSKIRSSDFVITDSFHCVVMCLKFHKPFAVVTEHNGNIGMNDRLYTLLDNVRLSNHIIYKEHLDGLYAIYQRTIDWPSIDGLLEGGNNNVLMFLDNLR